MDNDFPASHSMDSAWFAVDADGHVAYFDTGEDGLMPREAFIASWAYDPEVAERVAPLRTALTGAAAPAEAEEDIWFEPKALARLGLFVYDSQQGDAGLPWGYDRTAVPKQPLHVDQLPPGVRQALKGLQLGSVHFTTAKQIFPSDHADCDAWGPAYLCSDGKTVRPIRGREDEYKALCTDLADDPDAAHLHFEGLDNERPPKRKRGR